MLESAVVYAGLLVTLAGLALGVRAVRRPEGELGASRRKRAAAMPLLDRRIPVRET